MLINLIGLKNPAARWTSWKKTSIRRPNLMTRKEAAPRILLAQVGGRKTLKIIQNQKGTQIHVVEGTHVANINKTTMTITINRSHNNKHNINSNNSHNRGT